MLYGHRSSCRQEFCCDIYFIVSAEACPGSAYKPVALLFVLFAQLLLMDQPCTNITPPERPTYINRSKATNQNVGRETGHNGHKATVEASDEQGTSTTKHRSTAVCRRNRLLGAFFEKVDSVFSACKLVALYNRHQMFVYVVFPSQRLASPLARASFTVTQNRPEL